MGMGHEEQIHGWSARGQERRGSFVVATSATQGGRRGGEWGGVGEKKGGGGMEKSGSLEKVDKKGGGLEKVCSGYGEKRWGLVRV